MQQGLGALFSAGWTVADVMGLTWGQLGTVTECVMEYRMLQINTVMEIATTVLGGKVDKKAKSKSKKGGRKSRKKKSGKSKNTLDAATKLSLMGFSVTNV